MTSTGLRRVTVIGCGLIGTSIALALTRAGVEVALEDRDRSALDQARRMGAGRELTSATPSADLVVIATPPAAVVDVLYTAQARGLGRAYTDVAGTKEIIWAEAEMRGSDLMGYIPGHPMAGREQSGPGAARADLFVGQPWILCPYPTAQPEALKAADALVSLCGGRRRDMTPEEHDEAVAVVSHVPQLVCSVLAAQLVGVDREVLTLAGAGLRDTTRIAGSDRRMWSDIFAQNPEAVADVVDRIAGQLSAASNELRNHSSDGSAVVSDLLGRGNLGRAALLEAVATSGAPEVVPAGGAAVYEGPAGPEEDAAADGTAAAGDCVASGEAAGGAAGPAAGGGGSGEGAGEPDGAPQRRSPEDKAERPGLDGWILPLPGARSVPAHRPQHGPLRMRQGRPAGPVPRIHRFAG